MREERKVCIHASSLILELTIQLLVDALLLLDLLLQLSDLGSLVLELVAQTLINDIEWKN